MFYSLQFCLPSSPLSPPTCASLRNSPSTSPSVLPLVLPLSPSEQTSNELHWIRPSPPALSFLLLHSLVSPSAAFRFLHEDLTVVPSYKHRGPPGSLVFPFCFSLSCVWSVWPEKVEARDILTIRTTTQSPPILLSRLCGRHRLQTSSASPLLSHPHRYF